MTNILWLNKEKIQELYPNQPIISLCSCCGWRHVKEGNRKLCKVCEKKPEEGEGYNKRNGHSITGKS